MSLLIGMDEAGLGPNLGPFVVAATVWEVPGPPCDFDFWSAFDTVLTNAPTSCDPRLHVADSKQVFQPSRGLGALERGIGTALKLCGVQADSFAALCHSLRIPLHQDHSPPSVNTSGVRSLFSDTEFSDASSSNRARWSADEIRVPWYEFEGISLPVESADITLATPWQHVCQQLGVKLLAIRADVVEPLRFNRLVRTYNNKSQATSRLAMNLLSSVWKPDGDEALIVADKHGGRNRYDGLLHETFGKPVQCITEGAEQSTYRLGRGELRFQPRTEVHGPVALASMAAKYLRELAMHQFNHFWKSRIPDLKPTQGYPVDAKRFRADIAAEQVKLDIHDDVLWRER